MSEPLKVYSLDYLKEKKYSDDHTEDATRIECAGLAVGVLTMIQENGTLQKLSDEDFNRLKAAVFMGIIGRSPVGEAYINKNLVVIDSQENESCNLTN